MKQIKNFKLYKMIFKLKYKKKIINNKLQNNKIFN